MVLLLFIFFAAIIISFISDQKKQDRIDKAVGQGQKALEKREKEDREYKIKYQSLLSEARTAVEAGAKPRPDDRISPLYIAYWQREYSKKKIISPP